MAVKPPMILQFKKNEKGMSHMLLDGKEIHHVREYKIESTAYEGKAELSIKMLVQFPVSQEKVSSEKNKDTRYAYEWFMREEDKRYWRQTEKLVEKEKKKIIKIMATLTIVSMAIIETNVFVALRKFSKR